MSLFCYNCYAVDVTGQVLGNLIDELLAKGARDVSIIPATMKKGRSGSIIQVIAKLGDSDALARKMIEDLHLLPVWLASDSICKPISASDSGTEEKAGN